MSTINKLDLAQWVIEQATRSGADEAAVSITNQRDVEFQYRDKKLEKSERVNSERTLAGHICPKKIFEPFDQRFAP